MERTIPPSKERKLMAKAPLPVDPRRSIAIKRDVHRFEVACDAAALARAFGEVMEEPSATFGLIRVKRPERRMGRPFEKGERFQGCFSLEMAIGGALARWPNLRRIVGAALANGLAARAVAFIEDQALSDYGEIVAIDMDPAPGEPHRLEYRYLEGTPIAGRSVFTIEGAGAGRSLLTQVLEFQEVNGMALAIFQRIGLKWHDGVVAMQVERAAERARASVISGTIPLAYAAA